MQTVGKPRTIRLQVWIERALKRLRVKNVSKFLNEAVEMKLDSLAVEKPKGK